jgi:hypothetical protein
LKTKIPELRLICEKILKERTLLALSLSDIENNNKFREILNQSFSIEQSLSPFFIRKKYKLFKQSEQTSELIEN